MHVSQIEYDVPKCEGSEAFGCVHTFNQTMVFPDSGKFVTSIGHAHVGSLGMTYWGEVRNKNFDLTLYSIILTPKILGNQDLSFLIYIYVLHLIV